MDRYLDERGVLWLDGSMICMPGSFLNDLETTLSDARLLVAFAATVLTDKELLLIQSLGSWRKVEEYVSKRYKEFKRGLEAL